MTGATSTTPRAARSAASAQVMVIVTAVAWAGLLLLHADPGADVADELRGETTRWIVVHLGSMLLLGLLAVALTRWLDAIDDPAGRVMRVAMVAFVLWYGATEAVLGVATGVVVASLDDAPPGDQAGVASAARTLWDDPVTADLLPWIGSVAWVVVIGAAVVALRRSGRPWTVCTLVGISAVTVFHAPPFGPVALVALAAAAALDVRWLTAQRAARP